MFHWTHKKIDGHLVVVFPLTFLRILPDKENYGSRNGVRKNILQRNKINYHLVTTIEELSRVMVVPVRVLIHKNSQTVDKIIPINRDYLQFLYWMVWL